MAREKSEITKAAEKAGLTYSTMYARIHIAGMTLEEALAKPYSRTVIEGEIKEFILDNYKGITTKRLASLVNERFNTCFSEKRLLYYKKNHKLNSGLTGCFTKGHEPKNKGKRIEEFMTPQQIERFKANQFTKGHTPHNHVEIGEEVMSSDGYLRVKIREPNVWRQKHIILWERYHGKKVPKDSCVTFLDGDHENLSKDNLVLIARTEHLIMNKQGLRSPNKEITHVGVNIARLQSIAIQKQRKMEEQDGIT